MSIKSERARGAVRQELMRIKETLKSSRIHLGELRKEVELSENTVEELEREVRLMEEDLGERE